MILEGEFPGGMRVLSARRRRERRATPVTAAGLLSFYEEYEGKVKISPTIVVGAAILVSAVVAAAHIFLPAVP
ncbi:preprotein translocase subunit SecG [Aeropyrum pernix]|uniref:Preprotein translocase subunit SecG n=1 Tax=Aeropyrum pernix TaxID=56636 RepID=A0A401H868_AERPX|nr:preprotein translocase subunit SecG [Aeropyrum pernix]